MEKLSIQKRAQMLLCLCEGNSLAATARICGVGKNVPLAYLPVAGEALSELQNRLYRGLVAESVQLDEVWSFVGCKEHNKEDALSAHPGTVWTWTAICTHSKLIPSWYVSQERGLPEAMAFCYDLAPRFANKPQIVSDGLQSYKAAIAMAFDEPDYCQIVKQYKKGKGGRKYCESIRKEAIHGNPDLTKATTSHMERANLTIRMGNRRFTRLTNGHSKKLENHAHQLTLQMAHYNLVRKHQTLKQTPAQAAGIATRQWTMADLVTAIDQYALDKEEQAFETAFEARPNFAKPRKWQKTFAPTPKEQIKLPWYLDKYGVVPEHLRDTEPVV